MQFPIAIHKDKGSVYGVTVPDIPGCHSFGESVEDAIKNAKEAILGHLQVLLELGEYTAFVTASSVESLNKRAEFKGAIWGLVDIDQSEIDPTPERVNISIPRFVLRQIDEHVKKQHETRSGFLARVAIDALTHSHG